MLCDCHSVDRPAHVAVVVVQQICQTSQTPAPSAQTLTTTRALITAAATPTSKAHRATLGGCLHAANGGFCNTLLTTFAATSAYVLCLQVKLFATP
jgi:hypothetical protein